MVHHARVGRGAAQSAGSAVMIAGISGTRVMGQTHHHVAAESMMTVGRVHVIDRGRDRRWMMMSSGRIGAGLTDRTGAWNNDGRKFITKI